VTTAKSSDDAAAAKADAKHEAAEAKAAKEVKGPKTYPVLVSATGFSPARVECKCGDTVTWTNTDTAKGKHSVKFLSGPAPKPEKPAKGEPAAVAPEPKPVKLAEHEHDKLPGHEAGTLTAATHADKLPGGSGRILANKSFSYTFEVPGTYEYGCESDAHMRGTVVVS
jgi:plastocyanin